MTTAQKCSGGRQYEESLSPAGDEVAQRERKLLSCDQLSLVQVKVEEKCIGEGATENCRRKIKSKSSPSPCPGLLTCDGPFSARAYEGKTPQDIGFSSTNRRDLAVSALEFLEKIRIHAEEFKLRKASPWRTRGATLRQMANRAVEKMLQLETLSALFNVNGVVGVTGSIGVIGVTETELAMKVMSCAVGSGSSLLLRVMLAELCRFGRSGIVSFDSAIPTSKRSGDVTSIGQLFEFRRNGDMPLIDLELRAPSCTYCSPL